MTTPSMQSLREALEAPPPRRIRIARHGITSLLVLPGILASMAVVGGIVLMALSQCSRAEEDAFLESGVQTEGRISHKSSRYGGPGRSPITTLRYVFDVDGESYQGEKDYGDPFAQVGDTIVVTYDPISPNRNREGVVTEESIDARSPLPTPMLLLIAITLLLSLILFLPGLQRLRHLAHLARTGLVSAAEIQSTSERGITFMAENGLVVGQSTQSRAEGRSLIPGEQVLVVYNPLKPEQSVLLTDLDDLEVMPERGHQK